MAQRIFKVIRPDELSRLLVGLRVICQISQHELLRLYLPVCFFRCALLLHVGRRPLSVGSDSAERILADKPAHGVCVEMIFSRKGINIRIALQLLRKLEEHLPERVQESRPLLGIIHTVLFCHISHPENEGILCIGKSSLHLLRSQRSDELIGILIRRQVNDPGFDPRILQDRDCPHGSHSSGSVRVIEKENLLCIAAQK